MSAQRADDRGVRPRASLAGPGQSQEAALAEGVKAAELPGTPATGVVGPVTDPAFDV